ncbi:Alpha-1,3/1,6-mannosyltransferase ALG2 [Dirofilaria immitis]|nr:Alpha-1,3/1,6-mannosyltransferase ALG2 [Dirofilaria immitis]
MLITIIHPDLGIGGAERLVVDAAVAMKQSGHKVQFVTNYFNPKHAFIETAEFDIKVIDLFPRSIFGFGHALCAYIRMCVAALYICIFLKGTELIFCDSTWTIAMADLICVNSEFTKEIVNETFPCIRNRRLLKKKIPDDDYRYCFLVIAGGYNTMNDENIAHFVELKKNAVTLDLPKEQYIFLKSPTDEEKLELLRRATAVLYTPSNEHFGIVPVEAMYMECCVIALNSGGPRETIIDGETGFLVKENPNSFAEKMAELVKNKHKAVAMGIAGRKRIKSVFAMDNFVMKLENLIHEVVSDPHKQY